jgi:hypothetical protein
LAEGSSSPAAGAAALNVIFRPVVAIADTRCDPRVPGFQTNKSLLFASFCLPLQRTR